MVDFSIWDIVRNLLMATRWTIVLSLVAFIGGGVVGLLLLYARVGGNRIADLAVRGYVQVFQGTPLLIQLFLAFFGIAALGVPVSPWIAASVCLTLYSSAYLAEIWRGCVDAVPKGQWEAAKSLGLSFAQQLRLIVLPQAAKIAIAPTVGFMVQVIKGTALASIIGFVEITKTGTMITNVTFKPFLVYSFVALFYFALCYPLSWWSKWLELRLAVAGR
ncbi:MAG TPA: amino acid ABC transporter permease [Casimicrobium huifangae]|jgi:polar amino acid transport system permease protein|uniref:amino acid ABC transporter permease n=1 Tax=Casimicrobium huifangae TaxID=2591109 RepID=UPI0012EB2EC0|nr:amino acid ABC transporter permease [Casimicrobium huifangae]HOB01128.1 amino acid ABC transporter permease [Casimicrobium huifangae]HQA32347.1 amino acid ABC transporter permease [Casimicrobium huifangae]HQD63802.1 amino acid ABC transporter permease [Casimicrobium huifangae]